MKSNSPLLSIRNLSYSTPDGRSLGSGINTELNRGEILLITGPNGSGKTTLLDTILGKQTSTTGTVNLRVPDAAISYLPQLQDNQTHLPFSLRDIIAIAVKGKLSDSDITSLGLINCDQLPLSWNSSSGGEKRRALLTRTLLQQPELIVLDEPFNHLDTASRKIIVTSLYQFVSAENKCVILCTHEGFREHLDSEFNDVHIVTVAL